MERVTLQIPDFTHGKSGWSHVLRLLLRFCSKIFKSWSVSEFFFNFDNPTVVQIPKTIYASKNHILSKPFSSLLRPHRLLLAAAVSKMWLWIYFFKNIWPRIRVRINTQNSAGVDSGILNPGPPMLLGLLLRMLLALFCQ